MKQFRLILNLFLMGITTESLLKEGHELLPLTVLITTTLMTIIDIITWKRN